MENNWIKVSEHPPTENMDVYVFRALYDYAQPGRVFNGTFYLWGRDFEPLDDVTHYIKRIVPEPPKD